MSRYKCYGDLPQNGGGCGCDCTPTYPTQPDPGCYPQGSACTVCPPGAQGPAGVAGPPV